MTQKTGPHKNGTHKEVLPPSVYALRGIIFYTVAKINQNLYSYNHKIIIFYKILFNPNV